ncbi:uncharacterized protein LOC133305458 [Gastrolobium bilobum]|uniref:uncharacterized protein LOC133305458 n=1 Tax=Gastrolobium bilobum TaxID=150636 RepID=UPI002AB1F546|nr:uncharacterized protein LOC133305458 [Gastrolobium bilobum]
MGVCFSCNSSSTFKNIRVVHLNGYVEDFDQPISARQVIGNPPKHFVCTSIQLLCSSSQQLNGDTQLQPGQVYFVLPYSVLQPDVSPVDLASLAKKLTAIAKTKPCESLKATSSMSSQNVWSSPSMSPGRFGVTEQYDMSMMNRGRSPCRVQPWKPILDSISEKSLTRRSESDLQDNN